LNISNSIERIKKFARENRFLRIQDIFNEIYVSEIRNSFFHSRYLLGDRRYHLLYDEKLSDMRFQSNSLDIESELVPVLHKTIRFASTYFKIREEQTRSYLQIRTITPTHSSKFLALKIIPMPTGIAVTVFYDPTR
jgi:hypothetical protein